MSLNISYEEAMGISRTNPHSQFIQSSSRKHIKLLPKYIGNIKAGIVEQLDNQLYVYSSELGGVPVAYKNIRLVQNMGRIMADQTCIHFDISADFVLFKPQVGCTLRGVINKIGKQHIGCLVHDKFNAWIPRLNPGTQTEDLAGEEVQFVVTNIFTNNNILSLKGRVEESSFTVLKKHKKKNTHKVFDSVDSQADDSDLVTASQFESGAALSSTRIDEHSPEHSRKKKKKKHKHSFKESDSVNETGETSAGSTGLDEHSHESVKKKKHKHSFNETECSNVIVNGPTEMSFDDDRDWHSKKRKRKSSTRTEGHSNELTDMKNKNSFDKSSSINESAGTSIIEDIENSHSKKKKRKNRIEEHSYVSTDQSSSVNEPAGASVEDLDDGHSKRKKKKKKHKL